MLTIPPPLKPWRTQGVDRAVDVLLLTMASGIAVLRDGVGHWPAATSMASGAILLWLIAARVLRHYSTSNGRGALGDVALTMVLLAAVVTPMGVAGELGWVGLTLSQARWFALMVVPSVLVVRWVLVGAVLWSARPADELLVVGTGALGRITGSTIARGDSRGRVIGYLRFDDEAPHSRLPAPVLGTVEQLESVLRERAVDAVYLASTSGDHFARVQDAILTCERFGVPFALPACPYRLGRARPAREGIADGYVHYLSMRAKPLQKALKRAFDILASACALIALSPVLVATAVAVELTSRGPVLFRQERVGLHGRPFHMLKFRSMVVNAEDLKAKLMAHNEQSGPVFKMKQDPRITGVGRFIRKFSIDELPQLVNVLRGDMTIVGPRPAVPSEVARYEVWQRRRLSVRPGLTCVWQVSGRNNIQFEQWMRLDLEYIDHFSLLRDMSLIFKTVPVVLTGSGAS
jgi:exopolysaccharide biosynthesis polyprenyl glycosylphosphotransferase